MTPIKHQVIVVGRGFAGLTTAFRLALEGYDVGVISPEFDPATASSAAQGVSTLKGLNIANQELFSLKMKGHKSFFKWLELVENKSERKIQKIEGVWEFFLDFPSFSHQQSRIYKNEFTGLYNVKGEGKSKFKSFITEPVFYSQYYPEDFWVDTDQYLEALAVAAKKIGVSFYSNKKVLAVNESAERVTTTTDDNSVFLSNIVVLCAGSGVAQVDLCWANQEKLFAAPGFTLKDRLDSKEESYCVVKELIGVAVTNNTVFIGSTTESNGIELDKSTNQKLMEIKTSNQEMIIQFGKLWQKSIGSTYQNQLKESAIRWGVRVRTKARTPIIKYISEKSKIIINTGYYKMELLLLTWAQKKFSIC